MVVYNNSKISTHGKEETTWQRGTYEYGKAAGIVAETYSNTKINNCSNVGTISGTTSEGRLAGGIVGFARNNTKIS